MALRCACELSESDAAKLALVSRKKLRTYEREPSRVRGRRERSRLERLYGVVLPRMLADIEATRAMCDALMQLGEPRLDSIPPAAEA